MEDWQWNGPSFRSYDDPVSTPYSTTLQKPLRVAVQEGGANRQPKPCLADRPLGADRLRLASRQGIWCSRTEPPRHQTEPPPRAPAGRRWRRRSRASTNPRQPTTERRGPPDTAVRAARPRPLTTWPQQAATPAGVMKRSNATASQRPKHQRAVQPAVPARLEITNRDTVRRAECQGGA